MNTSKIPIRRRKSQDIYLEYANDWITVENMAQYYGVTEVWLGNEINKGKYLNNKGRQS